MVYRATAKTEATKVENHDKILTAAHKLILKGGFKAITMSGVAQRANVATGSMYRYFPNKVELCTQLFRQLSAIEVQQLADISALSSSPAERLGQCCRTFVSRAFRGPMQSYALIAEPLDPALETERLVFRKAYAKVFAKIINQGIDQGEFPSQDAELAATAIVGMLAEPLIEPLRKASSAENQALANKIHIEESMATLCLRSLGFITWELLPTKIGNNNER